MNHRKRIHNIISGNTSDRYGFWLGNPDPKSWSIYYRYFGTDSQEDIRRRLGDDIRWLGPQFVPSTYRDVEHMDMFFASLRKTSHGQAGPFADCEKVGEVHTYNWPDAGQLDFTETLGALDRAGDVYRFSGFWTCFYHNCMDLFGMENYMIKMHTHPDVVHAVTDRVCQFYYDANERFFTAAGDRLDGFFFGNDFGTQTGLICGPEQFNTFIMPWFKRFADQGHEHGHHVILHSCGAIHGVIDDLIEAGIDGLHPLPANAAHMDAESISRKWQGKIAFMGGIDTQDLLVNATPDEIRDEVERIKELLGPHFIVSPSHEALLPNVPPENVHAMAEAAVS